MFLGLKFKFCCSITYLLPTQKFTVCILHLKSQWITMRLISMLDVYSELKVGEKWSKSYAIRSLILSCATWTMGQDPGPIWYFAAVSRDLHGWAKWALPLCILTCEQRSVLGLLHQLQLPERIQHLGFRKHVRQSYVEQLDHAQSWHLINAITLPGQTTISISEQLSVLEERGS